MTQTPNFHVVLVMGDTDEPEDVPSVVGPFNKVEDAEAWIHGDRADDSEWYEVVELLLPVDDHRADAKLVYADGVGISLSNGLITLTREVHGYDIEENLYVEDNLIELKLSDLLRALAELGGVVRTPEEGR